MFQILPNILSCRHRNALSHIETGHRGIAPSCQVPTPATTRSFKTGLARKHRTTPRPYITAFIEIRGRRVLVQTVRSKLARLHPFAINPFPLSYRLALDAVAHIPLCQRNASFVAPRPADTQILASTADILHGPKISLHSNTIRRQSQPQLK